MAGVRYTPCGFLGRYLTSEFSATLNNSPARILGTRALQLSLGAPPMVDYAGETDPLMIAKKELQEKKIPITIRRRLPDGSTEEWSLEDLTVQ